MKTTEEEAGLRATASLAHPAPRPTGLWSTAGWALLALAALEASYTWRGAGFLVIAYVFGVVQMGRAGTWRQAFYPGLAVGTLVGVLQLGFFWRIFLAGAVALWIVFAFWIGMFVLVAHVCLQDRTGQTRLQRVAWLAIPFLWCGLEYFRSELYYLRFAWLSPGFAFAARPDQVPFAALGTYGVGFLLAGFAGAAAVVWRKSKWKACAVLFSGAVAVRFLGACAALPADAGTARTLRVAGVQLEFPTEKQALLALDTLIRKEPDVELIVLSEYTFSAPVPEKIRNWCRDHHRYLIAGGKSPAGIDQFYNTAFVVSPTGEIVFHQGKSVPIQFFKDGLPAREQRPWASPWGKLGICICYDLSYSRVTDGLVKAGADALIVPTMDVADWGESQHALHARIAPVRAAEYGIPVFRLASSGISQVVDRGGRVLASAPYPGDGALVSGTLSLNGPGHLPLDRWLAPFAVVFTLLWVAGAACKKLITKPFLTP